MKQLIKKFAILTLAVALLATTTITAKAAEGEHVVVIKSVSVKKVNKEGEAWDINNGAPDLMVVVRNSSERDSKEFKTEEKEDTYAANFNAVTTVKLRADQELTIEVIDVDAVNNDLIGKMTRKFTAEELKEGKVELKNFGQVIRLELEIKSLK